MVKILRLCTEPHLVNVMETTCAWYTFAMSFLTGKLSQVSKLQNICNFSIFSFHVGMWKKKIKTKVAFGQKHFVPGRSSKSREYSYRQSDTCPWIKCKPVTFLNNGNDNNSSQHLQNTSYTLCEHHLAYSSEQHSAAFTVAIWLIVSGGAGDSNPNALLTPYLLD